MKTDLKKRFCEPRAFLLMEVVIAIAIIAIALVPLIGLIPAGIKNSESSHAETLALDLLSAVIQDIRYSPPGESESPIFHLRDLPYNGAALGVENRVRIDRYLNFYSSKQQSTEELFDLVWIYTKSESGGEQAPIKAKFTIHWPPNLERKGGERSQGGSLAVHVLFPNPRLAL